METSQLTKYLLFQIGSAKEMAAKISKDANPEYLHRFRVALRRSRSLLELYIPRSYAIQEVLKSLFRTTNEPRELDVLLLSIDPDRYPKLYMRLLEHRNRRYEKILTRSYLKRAAIVLDRIQEDLRKIDAHLRPDELEAKAIKHYKKSQKKHRSTTPGTTPKELHRLRIKFKTSRYALEFIQESGIAQVKERIEKCKSIQDRLGAVQDTRNQLELLKSFCKKTELHECERVLKERKKQFKILKRQTVSSQSA